ncbi:tRNA1(Val) (adenine(37)-N6)-methyltransferase [Telluribacter sp. SYSU D00476]|uniref:tRNA1(Val) (adenine(37)-N6)-methyltransferase n=1 Tax=Telluribacter sp. SYSU D00476 TaxID=2811430 RepID=UPI001FF23C90|nr:methyltransferase [Telluribacter sp. SYSU D00476]
MPRNHSFRFKQFTVQQDQCAMKVCTDACVLGAWAQVDGAKKVLDIGTGTGLLSLMVAQRTTGASIDAIELDEAAAQQARDNVAASPFTGRVQVIHTPIQQHKPQELYDCIITNPPFFQADLRSPDAGVNQAHHAQDLTFAELLAAIDRLLKKTGVWNVLLPVEESDKLQQLAEVGGWVPTHQLLLTHQPGRKPFRMLSTYVHNERRAVTNMKKELFIYETDGRTYSPEFRELLKEFYIIF